MLKNSLIKTTLAITIASFASGASANILTSIKPLGFIASSIADGVTDTEVLVPAGASPHDYSLKPSDVEKLKNSELVLWIGKDVDSFLENSLQSIPSEKVLTIAGFKEIESFLDHEEEEEENDHDDHEHDHDHVHKHHDHEHEHHNHAHEHKDHDNEHKHEHKNHEHEHHAHEHYPHDHHGHDHSTNWHVWYSAEISKAVAERLAKRLTENYPEKAEKIAQNLADFKQSLAAQQAKIKQQLAPVKETGFYVFHDAYSYFNEAYDLNQVGYFTINPLVVPGAKTLQKIKGEIKEHKVSCLFAEPQFTPKVIETLRKATNVKVGQLDPMGDKVKLGKNAYAEFLQHTANNYLSCLNK